MAKKGKAAAQEEPVGPARVEIATELPVLELQVKRLKSKAVLVQPGQDFTATIEGTGKLAVVVYQALEADQKVAKQKVSVSLTRNGKSEGTVSFRGKRDKAVALSAEGLARTYTLLGGGESKGSATVLGAAGLVSFEVRIDAGYGWTQSADVGEVVRGFSPSGFEVGTRFRFVP